VINDFKAGARMSNTSRQKTMFLNGVEVGAIEPTGNRARDLAIARRFLAENGVVSAQTRSASRTKRQRSHLRLI
jgi:stage V sporulation protein SpoVS